MTSLSVDASVAVRWFVPALAWPQATRLLESTPILVAPELILAETANAFWKAVRAEVMTAGEMRDALRQLPSFFARLIPAHELLQGAAEMAVTINHPVYDCFYLTLAERDGMPLVTADKRLAAAAKRLSDIQVQLLTSEA
jgi:predicted nucleic acid-binding protein